MKLDKLPKQVLKYRILYTTTEYDKEANGLYTDYNIEAETDNLESVAELLAEVFKNTGFKIYYTRCAFFTDENYFWYDYGSHSCFVELRCLDKEAYNAYVDLMHKRSEETGKENNQEGYN